MRHERGHRRFNELLDRYPDIALEHASRDVSGIPTISSLQNSNARERGHSYETRELKFRNSGTLERSRFFVSCSKYQNSIASRPSASFERQRFNAETEGGVPQRITTINTIMA